MGLVEATGSNVVESDTKTYAGPDLAELVRYRQEEEDEFLEPIRELITKDLSEPYSIYVYRYFLFQWPELCWMVGPLTCKLNILKPCKALDPKTRHLVGVVVCKQERHRSGTDRGYIAMLAVEAAHRGRGLGSRLVERAVASMAARGADEVVLETEVDNAASLRLYEKLGFVRMKHLHRYYLNGNSAFRLMRRLRDLGSHQGSSDEGVPDDEALGQP